MRVSLPRSVGGIGRRDAGEANHESRGSVPHARPERQLVSFQLHSIRTFFWCVWLEGGGQCVMRAVVRAAVVVVVGFQTGPSVVRRRTQLHRSAATAPV